MRLNDLAFLPEGRHKDLVEAQLVEEEVRHHDGPLLVRPELTERGLGRSLDVAQRPLADGAVFHEDLVGRIVDLEGQRQGLEPLCVGRAPIRPCVRSGTNG